MRINNKKASRIPPVIFRNLFRNGVFKLKITLLKANRVP